MADIKTKDNAKGTIRTIDKAAVATQRMKQAYIATKEKAERSVNANSSSAEEYASDKLESGIDEVFHDGAYAFDKAGRKGLETTKENIRTAKDGIQRFKQQRAEQSLRKQASQNTSSAIKTVDKAEKTIKQSATSSGKKTIKFAGKEATKTAQKSVKPQTRNTDDAGQQQEARHEQQHPAQQREDGGGQRTVDALIITDKGDIDREESGTGGKSHSQSNSRYD